MSFNGDNVPDDMRHSDHWDGDEYVCPSCGDGMREIEGKINCDSESCDFVFDIECEEPDFSDEEPFYEY